jgi:hypothetical protein
MPIVQRLQTEDGRFVQGATGCSSEGAGKKYTPEAEDFYGQENKTPIQK